MADNLPVALMHSTSYSAAGSAYRFPVKPSRPSRIYLWLGLISLLLIVYGSLVPLDFRPYPLDEAWRSFLDTPFLHLGAQSRADWIANLLLYIVPAYCLSAWLGLEDKGPGPAGVAAIVVLCAAVAVGVEFVQQFFPPRTVSLNDLQAEALGITIGIGLWFAAGRRLHRTWLTVSAGGPAAIRGALALYILLYLALALFPYDFVISAAEWRVKLAGDTVGLLVAPVNPLGLRWLATTLTEVLVVVPIGIQLGLLWGDRQGVLIRVALAGVALSGVIELLQLFQVSGVAQGLSLLTRPGGMVLGWWLWRRGRWRQPPPPALLRGLVVIATVVYLPVLAALNGWFGGNRLDLDTALNRLGELRLLPFYYHYYSTETAALNSLVRVALLYGMVGLGMWIWHGLPSCGRRMGGAVGAAALLAVVIEAGKLFVSGVRPDPTNVLIAAAAAGLAYALAGWVRNWNSNPTAATVDAVHPPLAGGLPATPNPARPAEPHPAGDTGLTKPTRHLPPRPSAPPPMPQVVPAPWPLRMLALPLLLLLLWQLAQFPVFQVWLALALAAYGLLLWYRPEAWLIVVPGLLPVLDLAPWSGRFFFGAYDLVLLLTLAMGLWHHTRNLGRARSDLILVPILIALVGGIALLRGLLPLAPLDANAFAHYFSPYNALRLAKGLLWALLLLPLLLSARRRGTAVAQLLTLGMITGLAATLLVIVWERNAYVGVLNFSTDYRISALFSGMHTGGAFIDGYLAVALPFALGCLWLWRHPVRFPLGIALFCLALYGFMVTFSRADLLALALGLAVLALLLVRAYGGLRLSAVAGGILLAGLAIAVMLPIVGGQFMQQRLATVSADLDTRLSHWETSLAIRDPGWGGTLLGSGMGSYPRHYFWRSERNNPPATYQIAQEPGNRFLRLGQGYGLYFGQRIPMPASRHYTLSLDLRSDDPDAKLGIALCQKLILASRRCTWRNLTPEAAGRWTPVSIPLQLDRLQEGSPYLGLPVELAVFSNGSRDNSAMDVDNVQLLTREGRALVDNSGFEAGMDHWFFTSDDHLPWHAKNLAIHLLVETGWVGLTAFVLLMIYTGHRLWQRAGRGDGFAPVLASALVGFLSIGLFDSLLDDPRMSLLLLLLVWMALLESPRLFPPSPPQTSLSLGR